LVAGFLAVCCRLLVMLVSMTSSLARLVPQDRNRQRADRPDIVLNAGALANLCGEKFVSGAIQLCCP
jgi:hypothetical protein